MSLNRIFITYGDKDYEIAKVKIIEEAKRTKEFQSIISYGREDLSQELLTSEIIKIERGGGLWSWKPDVILSTMEKCSDGDIIVYCDAGCTVYPAKEWNEYWKKLSCCDIIAQRIFQRSYKWTRKDIIDYFVDNHKGWLKCFQYQATPIFKNTQFSRQFVREWKNLMIQHPEFVKDVSEEELVYQPQGFIENRHDQAVFSALIYKYLTKRETNGLIYTQWEHIEDYDIFHKQAIRATRLRQGENEKAFEMVVKAIKRILKDFIYKPFYYAPIQWWYSRHILKM